MKKQTIYNLLFSLAAVVLLWAMWLIAALCLRNDYILPSFVDAFKEMGRLFRDAAFWHAFANTLLRTVVSFAVSLVLGVLLAVFARMKRGVRAFLAPIVSILRTVPTMAIILMLLIWTTPRVAPVVVTFLVLMPAAYAAALASFDEVKEQFGEMAETFRIPAARKIFKMYLPLSAPSILAQSGPILSMGLKITVSGEVLASTYQSVGGLMQEAKMFVEMPRLMALTLICIVLGFLLEGLFALLNKIVVRWRT